MRLADQIAQQSKQEHPAFMRSLADALGGAALFEITPSVALLARDIVRSPVAKFETAMKFGCRPFDVTWLEWQPAETGIPLGKKSIVRAGVLLEPASSLGAAAAGLMHFAWQFEDGHAEVCPCAVVYDFQAEPKLWEIQERLANSRGKLLNIADGGSDDLRFAGRFMPVLSQHALEVIEPMRKLGILREIFKSAYDDLQGETGFVAALLIVMNTKNLVEVSLPSDVQKLNRARARIGRAPAWSYRTVTIRVGSIARAIGGTSRGSATELRAHLVRGHFKVRKSGVFWWSPQVRGNAVVGAVAHPAYRVVTPSSPTPAPGSSS